MKQALKIIGRALLGLLGLVALAAAAITLLIVIDAQSGVQAADFTNTTFQAADGSTIDAYLAMPEGEGPFPGVLMVHEWWGMNAEITELAERMAAQGYVVLAPDTYRGKTTQQVPRALFLRLTTDDARVDQDMQAAYEHLASLPEVDADRIGVLGFCYGGGVALRHAIENPAIAATINLYGDTPSDPAAFGALLEPDAGPILSIFGAEDNMIPQEEVTAYQRALDEAGIDSTVTVYPGVGHAFVQPDVIDDAGSPHDAWQDMLAFLDAQLKG